MKIHALLCACVVAFACSAAVYAGAPPVVPVRVPEGGIQPQVAVDDAGALHLLYFKGDAGHGDLFYARSADAGRTFSAALRVNSQPGSAICVGTVRGPQIALGRGNRTYVVWMCSDGAAPRAPGSRDQNAPLLYARLNDAGNAFEPQRNLITAHAGLDGGLSVAADRAGNVYAVWHAPQVAGGGEASRRVWVARSADDGQSFSPEMAADPEPAGICGCCGMRAFCGRDGALYVSYRTAREGVNRDMSLLTSRDHAKTFTSRLLDPMKIGMCVMSTTMIAQQPADIGGGVLAAWETADRIYFRPIDAPASGRVALPVDVKPGKHPALAVNRAGETLVAWTEGTGWQKGGTLAWQVFDAKGQPLPGAAGRAPGLPVWSLPAAFAKADGSFVVLY